MTREISSVRQFLQLRLCGEGEQRHEWIYLQPLEGSSVIEMLSLVMRKSPREVAALIDTYDRFTLEAVIEPEGVGFCPQPISEPVGADPEFANSI